MSKPPRVVVVTGASGGIGRACARAFAARGDKVALLARGSTGLSLGDGQPPVDIDEMRKAELAAEVGRPAE